MSEFTIAPIKKMFKKAGAKRVSNRAAYMFGDIVEKRTMMLMEESLRLAQYRGKRTVMKEDVKMAVKRLHW